MVAKYIAYMHIIAQLKLTGILVFYCCLRSFEGNQVSVGTKNKMCIGMCIQSPRDFTNTIQKGLCKAPTHGGLHKIIHK